MKTANRRCVTKLWAVTKTATRELVLNDQGQPTLLPDYNVCKAICEADEIPGVAAVNVRLLRDMRRHRAMERKRRTGRDQTATREICARPWAEKMRLAEALGCDGELGGGLGLKDDPAEECPISQPRERAETE